MRLVPAQRRVAHDPHVRVRRGALGEIMKVFEREVVARPAAREREAAREVIGEGHGAAPGEVGWEDGPRAMG